MEALVLERKGELSIREIALPTEVAVLKPKLNEQGPRRYQPDGYYRSFANYHPPSFEVDTKNFAAIRSGSSYFEILGLPEEEFPCLARFEEEDFHDRSKRSEEWLKEDFLCNLCRRNAICTKRYSVSQASHRIFG
jgi:hypothetical protein